MRSKICRAARSIRKWRWRAAPWRGPSRAAGAWGCGRRRRRGRRGGGIRTPGACPRTRLLPGVCGRAELEQELAYRIPWIERLARWTRAAGTSGYAGVIAGLCVAMTAAVMLATIPSRGVAAIVIALLALLAASDIGIAVVNLSVATISAMPRCCPDSNWWTGCRRYRRTVLRCTVLSPPRRTSKSTCAASKFTPSPHKTAIFASRC